MIVASPSPGEYVDTDDEDEAGERLEWIEGDGGS